MHKTTQYDKIGRYLGENKCICILYLYIILFPLSLLITYVLVFQYKRMDIGLASTNGQNNYSIIWKNS